MQEKSGLRHRLRARVLPSVTIINITEVNEEIFYVTDPIAKVKSDDIQWLKARALANKRERARICAHLNVDDAVHEMLIVHTKGTYIRPHKHPGKSESFHIIEGELDIVVFDDGGEVIEHINMGDYASGAKFFWRLSDSHYHMVIPRTDLVVFHETTSGPFRAGISSVMAPWSPEESDGEGQARLITRLVQEGAG